MLQRQSFGAVCLRVLLGLVFAAVSGSCSTAEPRTQVMLIIDADTEVRTLATKLEVEIESRSEFDHIDGAPRVETIMPMDEASADWPYSIALVPQGRDARRSYRITAKLFDTGAAIALLRAHSGFLAQQTLELRLFFSADCLRAASLECHEQETCFAGKCTPAQVDVNTLLPLSGGIANGFSPGDGGITWTPANGTRAPGVMTGTPDSAAAGSGGMSKPGDKGTPGDMAAPGDCGDGHLDLAELCDTAIAAAEPGACPSKCPNENPCNRVQLEGSGCLTQCKTYVIADLEPGDGCCPMGADANSDADCPTGCGNGIVEAGETCDGLETCPSSATCVSANPCLRAMVVGDAASCSATCVMQPVEECLAGDGCCPSACSSDTDNDCSASCGNGVVDVAAGELCEPMSFTQACPLACDDGNSCSVDYFTGSALNCNLSCTSVPTLLPFSGDQCCPPGANANNDRDCQAICGNRVVEPGERCDGRCPTRESCNDGNPCTVDGIAGDGCNVMCTHTLINAAIGGDGCCPTGANANNDSDCQPSCGNRVRELGELCDGDCPTTAASCVDDNNVCTVNVVTGTGCQRQCSNQQARAGDADGCCLDKMTMNSSTDPDCPGLCGNMRIDSGETCDPCPACVDSDPCTKDEVTGDKCNQTCSHTQLTGRAADGCCHDGDTSDDDPDCTNAPKPVCGNGRVETGEDCDGDCPPCDDGKVCTTDTRVAMCSKECDHTPVRPNLRNIDGCCPMGSNANEDADCEPMCPNGAIETGETCDPCVACPAPGKCMRIVQSGSIATCDLKCDEAPITAPAPGDSCCPPGANANTDSDCMPRCGNGEVERGEECDEDSSTCDQATCKKR